MDETTTALSVAIGGRVRQERQGRQWTLDRLAEAAGVSRRMLVSVEQGTVNPSVGTLLRIAEALDVGLPALVEPPQRRPVRVTRGGDGPVLWSSPAGGRGALVAGTDGPDVLELWEWTLPAGDAHASDAHAAGTKEVLQVHEGAVTIEVGGDAIRLEAGDAISFPGDLDHSYANAGTAPVRFSLAVFEPGVGARPRSEGTDD